MNSPPSNELLAAARTGVVNLSLLQDLARDAAKPAPQLLDELSYFVAKQYSAGNMSFEEADGIMNTLWMTIVSEDYFAAYDRTIPAATQTVFAAFDAGEYRHHNDAPSVDPEAQYTKPQIAHFLASRSNGA